MTISSHNLFKYQDEIKKSSNLNEKPKNLIAEKIKFSSLKKINTSTDLCHFLETEKFLCNPFAYNRLRSKRYIKILPLLSSLKKDRNFNAFDLAFRGSERYAFVYSGPLYHGKKTKTLFPHLLDSPFLNYILRYSPSANFCFANLTPIMKSLRKERYKRSFLCCFLSPWNYDLYSLVNSKFNFRTFFSKKKNFVYLWLGVINTLKSFRNVKISRTKKNSLKKKPFYIFARVKPKLRFSNSIWKIAKFSRIFHKLRVCD